VPAIPVQDNNAGTLRIWFLAGDWALGEEANGEIEKLRKPKAEENQKIKGQKS
jgi:hypothetical protein